MSERPARQTILGLVFGIAYAGAALGIFAHAGRLQREGRRCGDALISMATSGGAIGSIQLSEAMRLSRLSGRFDRSSRSLTLLSILPAILSVFVTFPIAKRACWRIVIGVPSPRDLLLRGPIAPGFEYSREAIRAARELGTVATPPGPGPPHVPREGEA